MDFGTRLRNRLLDAGMPIDTWGLPGSATNSVEDLERELRENSASISWTGPLICYRHSVCITISYLAPKGKLLLLHETEREYPDGSIRKRGLPYIRGTWRSGERIKYTAKCEIFEETGQRVEESSIVDVFKDPELIDPEEYISETYPELPTRRTQEHVAVQFNRHHYRIRGYERTEHGIITKTRWNSLLAVKKKPPTL